MNVARDPDSGIYHIAPFSLTAVRDLHQRPAPSLARLSAHPVVRNKSPPDSEGQPCLW
jgi:hypothetical protein